MIENREKQPNEVSAWTVAVGNIPLNPFKMKKAEKALKFIAKLEGFIGFTPCAPHGTLCLFKTENDAKGARNLMRAKGIEVGKNIAEVYIDKIYLEQAEEKKKGAGNESS